MLLIPGAIIGLILLHLYLVVRRGVTSPPWSKEEAGADRVDGYSSRPLPQGLTRPVARGNGGAK
jgi:quinol-cytochrome oxidoreductase complex cytochrome b subunit